MDIFAASSLVQLGRRLIQDLEGQKVVFLQLPPLANTDQWLDEIVGALCSLRPLELPTVLELRGDEGAPDKALIAGLDPSATTLEQALSRYVTVSSPVVLSIRFETRALNQWQGCFRKLERLYERGIQQGELRGLLVMTRGLPVLEPSRSAAISKLALWNPLRWEDLRMLAASWLDTVDAEPLMRSWQIASYTGAANGDPFLLRKICQAAPASLGALRACVLSSHPRRRKGVSTEGLSLVKVETQWTVPPIYEQMWSRGELIGVTLDRGALVPWDALSDDAVEEYEGRLIWQEQVTTLLPTLMQFSRQIGLWIDRHHVPGWEGYLQGAADSSLEPSSILQVFKNQALPRLPQALWALLQALRLARNELAHLRPVDAHIVTDIWQRFCTNAERYAGFTARPVAALR